MLDIRSKKTENIIVAAIMLLAAVLRFYNYAGWSLSNDELSALSRLRFETFGEMIRQGVMLGDFHPAGVQVFLWFWTRLFGDDVWIVRLPFVLCGMLSVYMVYLIGRRWFGMFTALFSASAMAFLEFPVLYSQLARPYSPGLLFSLVTAWFWGRIVFDEKRTFSDYAWYVLFTALAAYTHHYSFLFVGMIGLTGFVFYRKINLLRYVMAGLVVFLLYLPHLGIFLYQFGIGGVGGKEGWLAPPESGWLIDFLVYAFNGAWVTLIFILVFFTGTLFTIQGKTNYYRWISLSWFAMTFLVGFFYSIWRNPILQNSVMLFSFPFLLLFLFSFIDERFPRFKVIILSIFILAGTLQTTMVNRFYRKQHFGEFKDVAATIAGWTKGYGRENITAAIVVNGPFYIHYYLDKIYPGMKFEQYDNRGGKDFLALRKIVDSSTTDYFIYAWTKPAPPEIEDIIMTKYPCVMQRKDYAGLTAVTLFSKLITGACLIIPDPVKVYTNDFDHGLIWGGDGRCLDSVTFHSSAFSYKMDHDVEYSPALVLRAGDIGSEKISKVRITLWAYANEELADLPVVISVNNSEKGGYIWASMQVGNFVEPGTWGQVFFNFESPEILSPDDEIRVYLWNVKRTTFYIDDVVVEFYEKERGGDPDSHRKRR